MEFVGGRSNSRNRQISKFTATLSLPIKRIFCVPSLLWLFFFKRDENMRTGASCPGFTVTCLYFSISSRKMHLMQARAVIHTHDWLRLVNE